jgi:hypothetical protein
MKTLNELVDHKKPGINQVREWLAQSINRNDLLSCDPSAGERTLLALQVSTRTVMGAVAHETGGLLIDHGWVRILGAGSPQLGRGLVDWNGMANPVETWRCPGALLIADDVVGGFFAINGGAFTGRSGNIFYLAPDTLRWEDMDFNYTNWLSWLCTGDLDAFYENTRWPGWEKEVEKLEVGHGLAVLPYLCMAGPPVAQRSRRAIPIEELWELHIVDLPRQLGR